MKLFLLLSPILLFVYLLWCYKKYGMTKSISATWYKLAVNEQWLFGTMWLVYVTPIVLITMDRWFVCSALMLTLVAINPKYKKRKGWQDALHYIGSYAAIILSFVGLIYTNLFIGIIAAFIFVFIAAGIEFNFRVFAKIKNDTYWQEVIVAIPMPIILYFLL